MTMLCVLAAGKMTVIAASAFSLSWTHSVQKTEWREQWQVAPAGLTLVEARVKGSGAGMEPAEGSRLIDGWWVYDPALPPRPSILLASSGTTGSGWTLCANDQCMEMGAKPGSPVELSACAP